MPEVTTGITGGICICMLEVFTCVQFVGRSTLPRYSNILERRPLQLKDVVV